ncbi:MAG: alpha/beta fold hydrolase, partial [Verrucomicrobiae bacterium]|nr:alpha/beta fold hydrolase [Verrucomicrobiae bacterium]
IGWIGSEQFVVPTRRALEPRHLEALAHPAEFGFEIDEFTVVRPTGGGEAPLILKAALLSPSAQPGAAEKTRRMRDRLSQSGHSLPDWGTGRGTIVMLHGRSGIKEDAFPVAERFVAAGFRCLIYDARAHGQSGGRFSTFGAEEVDDLHAVIDTALACYGRETLGPLQGFGISLGAAVTLQALPEEPRLRSAVVVAPFAELPPIADRAVSNVISPKMPRFLSDLVMALGGWRARFEPRSVRPIDSAAKIGVPVMVVHGDEDVVIPFDDGRSIYEALPSSEKRWRPVEGGAHHNVLAKGNDELYQDMVEFYLEQLSGPADASTKGGT